MTDHAAVIREALRFAQRYSVYNFAPPLAALAALEQELAEAKQRIAYLVAEAHGWQPRLAKAEEALREAKAQIGHGAFCNCVICKPLLAALADKEGT